MSAPRQIPPNFQRRTFPLFLTMRAENRVSAAEDDALQRCRADGASPDALPLDLLIRRIAIVSPSAGNIFFEGNRILFREERQPFRDDCRKAFKVAVGKRAARSVRADPRSKKDLVRIDIADPRNDALVKQHRLDGFSALPAFAAQICRSQRGVRRFNAQLFHAARILLSAFRKPKLPQAPHVFIPQLVAVVKSERKVRMLFGRRALRLDCLASLCVILMTAAFTLRVLVF